MSKQAKTDPYAWIKKQMATMSDEERVAFLHIQLVKFIQHFDVHPGHIIEMLCSLAGSTAAWAEIEDRGYSLGAAIRSLSDGYECAVNYLDNPDDQSDLADAVPQGNG